METLPFRIATKNKTSRNKFNQKGERVLKQNHKTLMKENELKIYHKIILIKIAWYWHKQKYRPMI